jgi:hypothetical protein
MSNAEKLGKKIFYSVIITSFCVLFFVGFAVFWYFYSYVPTGPLDAVDSVKLGESAAVIKWKTKFPAKTRIEYGTSALYPNSFLVSEAYAESGSHSMLTLLPGRCHVFRIVAEDRAGRVYFSPFYSLE